MERPTITFAPASGGVGVPRHSMEISATFNVNMLGNECIKAPCGETDACKAETRWVSPNKLVITVSGDLLPDHEYKLSLGTERFRLKRQVGLDVPLTEWTARTE